MAGNYKYTIESLVSDNLNGNQLALSNRVLGKVSFIDLNQKLLDCVFPSPCPEHLQRTLAIESPLLAAKPLPGIISIAVHFHRQFIYPRDARQPVRFVEAQRFIALTTMFERSGVNDNVKQGLDGNSRVSRELFESGKWKPTF